MMPIKIHIKTDADFTPAGKRSARIVTHTRGVRRLWFYVSGRRYRDLAPTPENVAMAREWIAARTA